MKKQYISPLAHDKWELDVELLNTASITVINQGDLGHEIELDGSAESGVSSDSRRWSVWGDDEEDSF